MFLLGVLFNDELKMGKTVKQNKKCQSLYIEFTLSSQHAVYETLNKSVADV